VHPRERERDEQADDRERHCDQAHRDAPPQLVPAQRERADDGGGAGRDAEVGAVCHPIAHRHIDRGLVVVPLVPGEDCHGRGAVADEQRAPAERQPSAELRAYEAGRRSDGDHHGEERRRVAEARPAVDGEIAERQERSEPPARLASCHGG
jgi:hypothetical protein